MYKFTTTSPAVHCLALTPAQFLIGEPLILLPDVNMSSNHIISLSCRWKLITQVRGHFWLRWQREYQCSLSFRCKQQHRKQNPKEGHIVLLKDPAPYSTRWEVARIKRMHSGSDNTIRVAKVRTSEGLFKRPLHQLATLPDFVDVGGPQSLENEN